MALKEVVNKLCRSYKTNWNKLALPLALVAGFMVAGIDLNMKTGQIVILTAIPVLVGYVISYYRYSERISAIEIFGSLMILVGVLGVINCGSSEQS